MKFFIVFVLLNYVVFFSVFARASDFSTVPETSSSQLDNVDLSVWKIKHFNGRSGTGFFLSKKEKLFVTNFHVIHHDKEDSVENITLLQEGNSSSLKVKRIVALSALYDLALLEIEGEAISLRENPIESNELLFVSGYPRGAFKRMKKKGSILYEDSYSYTFWFNHFNLPGVSGSPVFDDEGQVVGVVHRSLGNMLIAININHLKKLVEGTTGLSCVSFIDPKICMKQELENLEILAKQGMVEAQPSLALMYYAGKNGVEENFEEAFFWWEQAAKQGHAAAQYNLAQMYYAGDGVEKSFEKAVFWWEQAAKQGHAAAQYNLAQMYYAGNGVEKSFEKAVFWWEQAAKRGHAKAQSILIRFKVFRFFGGNKLPN